MNKEQARLAARRHVSEVTGLSVSEVASLSENKYENAEGGKIWYPGTCGNCGAQTRVKIENTKRLLDWADSMNRRKAFLCGPCKSLNHRIENEFPGRR